MKNAIFLIFSWTDETHHPALLQRSQQMLFPIISSTEKYWEELSRAALFDGKNPHELADQMETLLSMLLWLSSGTDKPQYLNSSPGFTSLQNVSIYMEAFGVKEDPLEAFQPLDTGKLARSLELSPLFPKSENMGIQKIESWDAHMQHYLPIKRPRSLVSIG